MNPVVPDFAVRVCVASHPRQTVSDLVGFLTPEFPNDWVDERFLVFMLTDMNLLGQGDNVMQQVSLDTLLSELAPDGIKRFVSYSPCAGMADDEVCFVFRVFELCFGASRHPRDDVAVGAEDVDTIWVPP